MANGRHARGAEHLTAHLEPGPQAEGPVEPLDAVPTGRRRRVVEESPTPVPADLPRAGAPETAGTRDLISDPSAEALVPSGTGRRRRTVVEAEPVVPAPTGRRRRVLDQAPSLPVEAPEPAPGSGRRRRPAETVTEAAPAVPPTAVIELVADPVPLLVADEQPVVEVGAVAEVIQVGEPVAEALPELARRSHRRAAPAKKAHARSSGGHAARTSGGHAAARRKPTAVPAPSGTALIAGAAAVAVAAAGAIGAANSGENPGTTTTAASMSGIAALDLPQAAPLAEAASVDREQVRASRERARDALADRVAAAAALQKKQEAAARALAAAKARAQQLALLAKSYSLPVSGYRLTAGFGEGGYRWSSTHTGTDFACAYGTPIRAVAAGTVVFAGYDGAYGWKTVIRHADGTESWYAHQSQMLVRRGQVAAGQIIGRVGMTGNTSGPHLHLEIRVRDTPINPLTWLRAHGLRP